MIIQELPWTEFWQMFFMTLGAANTLPIFKWLNITIKKSSSKKLLGVIISNKLDFREHLDKVCKKTNLKLHALNKISRFLSPNPFSTIALWFWRSATGGLCIKWIRFTSDPYFYYWKTTRIVFNISWSPLVIYQFIKDV